MDPTLLIDTQSWIDTLGLPVATLVYCFISGFVPIFNTELFLVGVAGFVGPAGLVVIAVMAGLGQMLAKTIIYAAGRGTLEIPLGKYEEKREAWMEKFNQHAWGAGGLVLASAFLGWPPFYVISAVAGALAMTFWLFASLGFIGRTARFGLILALGEGAWKLWELVG